MFFYDQKVGCYLGLVNPDAFAVLVGLSRADCRTNLRGIFEQMKAEALGLA